MHAEWQRKIGLDSNLASQEIAHGLMEASGVGRYLEENGVMIEVLDNGLMFVDSKTGCLRPLSLNLADVELVDCVAVFWDGEEEVVEMRQRLEESGMLSEEMYLVRFDKEKLLAWMDQRPVWPEEDVMPSAEECVEESEVESEELINLREEVYRFGVESPGEIVKRYEWIDARSQNITEGLDVLLVESDGNDEERKFKTNGGVGLVMYGGQFGRHVGVEDLEPIANVVGMIFFEEAVPVTERKQVVRKVQVSVRRWLNNPKAQVLAVSQSLVDAWEAKGTLLVSEEEVKAYLLHADDVERVDHGFYAPSTSVQEVTLMNFEPVPTIGGTQLFLREKMGKLSNVQIIDFGWNFNVAHLSTMMGRPPWRDGVESYLRSGLFPRVSRLYRTDVLLASISPQLFNPRDETGMFVLGEIYQRFGLKEMKEQVRQRLPTFEPGIDWREWGKYLDEYKRRNYSQKSVYNAVMLSHAHQDHAAGLSFVRSEVPAVLSPWSWLLLMTDFVAGWHWTVQETLVQKVRLQQTKPGVSLPTDARPVAIMHDGEEIMLTPNVRLLTFEGYHSIPGSMPQLYQVLDNFGGVVASFAYPGDYRFDEHFFEEVGKRGVHTLFVEGTNIPGTHKLSAALTERDVARNIGDMVRGTGDGGLPIVRLVKGNIERLNNIIDEADGRQVVVSRKLARLLHMASIYTAAHGEDWWGRVKPPSLTDGLAIYRGNKATYYSWEKELMGMADYEVVGDEELSVYPDKYLLVMDHRDRITSIKAGGGALKEVRFIDSVYWVYGEAAKLEAKFVMDMCDQLGWTYYGDMERGRGGIVRPQVGARFHASGHIASFDDQVSLIAMTGAERLIVGHSEHPEVVARELARAFPKKDVVQRVRRPWETWRF